MKLLKLLFFILICELAGLIGSIFTFNSVTTWYPTLEKPFFNPPAFIFGPVWTFLYLLMGISVFLVWGKKKKNLKWFWIQLALNVSWSLMFFGFKNLLFAFVILVLLWFAIFQTIISFKKVDKRAAYLLYPYLAWVTFAGLLNIAIAYLNR